MGGRAGEGVALALALWELEERRGKGEKSEGILEWNGREWNGREKSERILEWKV